MRRWRGGLSRLRKQLTHRGSEGAEMEMEMEMEMQMEMEMKMQIKFRVSWSEKMLT